MSSQDMVYTVEDNATASRVDVFLAHHSGLSRSRIKKLIDSGYVVLEDGSPLKPSYHLSPGESVHMSLPPPKEPVFLPEKRDLDIVYEDESIIVINKPAGIVVHPGRGNMSGTLASALLYHCDSLSHIGGTLRPGIVHRLDKDTSGLIVAALNDDVHTILSNMIKRRAIKRTYTAFVWGAPSPVSGTINAPIGRNPRKPTLKTVVPGGRDSITHYTTTERYDFLTKLCINLETGRTHQIRVHMAYIGHHVFGDPSYGGREERLKGFSPEIRNVARRLLKKLDHQALHASGLEFDHPITQKKLCFEGTPPVDMKELEQELRRLSLC